MKSNQPPFAINQKVVCVKSGSNGVHRVTKGNTYTVLDILQCSCGKWKVDVGLRCGSGIRSKCGCGSVHKIDRIVHADAVCFAPYDPPKLEIPAELLEVKEQDCIDIKPVLAIAGEMD
jgi:hypothetical protein